MTENERTGEVIQAFGNLTLVKCSGDIRQGEVAFIKVDDIFLKAEVIEIIDGKAKLQVFEDTRGIKLGSQVLFKNELLEAELGPGLLSGIFDGLQNPLEELAQNGYFLPRGLYLKPLNRKIKWKYEPVAKAGEKVVRGDTLGFTREGGHKHLIMVPFSLKNEYTITWTIDEGSYTVDTIIAKGIDNKGREYEFSMIQKWPIKEPLMQGEKIKPFEMLNTGLRIIDTQFPLVKGGTFCTPGPFGAGKTVLQHHLSKFSSADIVILCACGERAGEVVEVLKEFPHLKDPYTDRALMERTVIICNTSSMPVAARESSIYMGITIAEYYRQMNLDVLLLADSTSRWAQALREMSGRLEEIPGDEAFPAYLSSRIAEFYERSGTLKLKDNQIGSLTIGGTVSPAGGNFEEPVTQATLSIVGAFLGLSRERSDARKYPSIDPLISWSKYISTAANSFSETMPNWLNSIQDVNNILLNGNEISKRMEVVGEEGTSLDDMITYLKLELYDFAYLQQNAFDKEDAYCPMERQMELFKLVDLILSKKYQFKSHEEARNFFHLLQSEAKNINSLSFKSDEYRNALINIEEKVSCL